MAETLTGGPGALDAPGLSPYHADMDIISNLADLPADRADWGKLPGDTVIGIDAWAALQGVRPATVNRFRTVSESRRGTPDQRAGDMPAADGVFGHSPYWFLSTFREWQARRPGKGAGAGRPAGTGKGRAVRVRLPLDCPHCRHEITVADLATGSGTDAPVAAGTAV